MARFSASESALTPMDERVLFVSEDGALVEEAAAFNNWRNAFECSPAL